MSSNVPSDPLVDFIIEQNPQDIFQMRELTNTALAAANNNLPEIGSSVDNVVIANIDGTDITVDIHIPKGEGPFPVCVYFHGGAWTAGSRKTHRKLCFRIAERGLLVFNVDYRLAPENPFPAGFEDSKLALDWVRQHAAEYGGDLSRLTLAGDSAGGNLAAALVVDDQNTSTPVKALGLVYPALELESWPQKIAAVPEGIPNLGGMMFNSLITDEYKNSLSDPRISPIHAAEKFPPTFITCGTADAMVYDGCELLPPKLQQAGVSCETVFYEGLPHGFIQMEEMFPQALESIQKMTNFLLSHSQ